MTLKEFREWVREQKRFWGSEGKAILDGVLSKSAEVPDAPDLADAARKFIDWMDDAHLAHQRAASTYRDPERRGDPDLICLRFSCRAQDQLTALRALLPALKPSAAAYRIADDLIGKTDRDELAAVIDKALKGGKA
jgi:hypothetical protein